MVCKNTNSFFPTELYRPNWLMYSLLEGHLYPSTMAKTLNDTLSTHGLHLYQLPSCILAQKTTAIALHCCILFTARNSSCGKLMFSRVCVIASVHRGGGVICIQGGSASRVGLHPGDLSRGGLPRGVCIWGLCIQGVCIQGSA